MKPNSNVLVSAIEDKQVEELYEIDDWGSSWKICKELGLKWGGRGFGGRAAGRNTVQTRDVVIEGCTMSYLGMNLLDRTTLRLLRHRRYGLIGRNGVGKSTLMRRIATATLPGFPQHLRVAYVQQELPLIDSGVPITPSEYILANDPVRNCILKQIEKLESDSFSSDEDDKDTNEDNCSNIATKIEKEAESLQLLYDMLEDENVVLARAVRVLKELGFSSKRRDSDMRSLSGGWRMRVSIACALTQEPDVLLLDEPTNHLDAEGVAWLKNYLLQPPPSADKDMTVLVISHDSTFLDDICTDIIRFHNQQLHYYPGNYSDYEKTRSDRECGLQRTQENVDKQRKHLEETIRKLQISASRAGSHSGGDAGQVASRKKKLARHGAEKNIHGHRFRAQLDSTNGLSAVRAGCQNEIALGAKTGLSRSLIDAAEREWSMSLPSPVPLSLLDGCSCLQLRSATIGFLTNSVAAASCNETSLPSPPPPPSTVVRVAPPSATTTTTITSGATNTRSLGSKSSSAAISASKLQQQAERDSNNIMNNATVVLRDITLDINQKSKIAILGKNGCGKSTLLKLIHNHGHCEVTNDDAILLSGEMFKHSSLRTAYFHQHQKDCLPYDQTPLQYLTNAVSTAAGGGGGTGSSSSSSSCLSSSNSLSASNQTFSEQQLRAHLGSFGLSGDLAALQTIGKLSGGQKARVVLAELTIHRPHLLLLDEPTNNLDMDSIRALKEAIIAYTGACIIASHDMNFVQATCSTTVNSTDVDSTNNNNNNNKAAIYHIVSTPKSGNGSSSNSNNVYNGKTTVTAGAQLVRLEDDEGSSAIMKYQAIVMKTVAAQRKALS